MSLLKTISAFFDIFLADFKWYRKLNGGIWVYLHVGKEDFPTDFVWLRHGDLGADTSCKITKAEGHGKYERHTLSLLLIDVFFENATPEEIEKYFPKDTTPKGWLSIEEYLPQMFAADFCEKGYSVFKVKDIAGNEFESAVSDHGTWYYYAKEKGYTHWLNE